MVATTETKPISIRLEAELLAHLRQVARYESYERNTDVTYADLIREAVLQVYPLPVQDDDDNDDDDEDDTDADTDKDNGA